jgi:hypothetical protein
VRVRRQATDERIRQPRLHDHQVPEAADRQRRQDAEGAARVPLLEQLAQDAEEAEPRALQQQAEDRAGEHRECGVAAEAGLSVQPERHNDDAGDNRRRHQDANQQAGAQVPPHTVPAGFAIGTPTALPYSVHEPSYCTAS